MNSINCKERVQIAQKASDKTEEACREFEQRQQ